MRWFAKKVVDIGGGKDLKSRYKSYSYFFKIFNFVKIRKILVEKTSKLSDRCTEKSTGSSVTLVNEKLKFARYNRSGGVGTRAARFIRKLLSSVPKLGYRAQNDPGAEILCNISAFIKKIIVASKRIRSDSCTEKMSDATSRCQPAGASCRGSILIEFAVCMPILIILLFYINDLVRIKRMYSQTEFVGQQMANILQNISKNQPVTLTNIKHACALAWLSAYHRTSEPIPYTNIYYISTELPTGSSASSQQTDPGKVACAWGIGLYGSPNGLWTKDGDTISSDKTSSTVRWGQNVDPSAIYPTLKMSDSREKIIIETQFRTNSGSPRTAFGLHLVNPPSKAPDGSRYFSSVVIFQPKSGLFNTNAPQ